jgi:hypothetical protein
MRMNLNVGTAALFGGMLLSLATLPAFGQAPPMTSADRAMQIAQTRQANAALMHHYNWNSRVEIVINGQVKDTRIEQVGYDSTGQLQHALQNEQKSGGNYLPTPIGFLRRAVATEEKDQLQQFLTGLKGLVEQYSLPTAGKILDFMTAAKPSGPDANGLFQMAGANVVVPGDSLTLWVNPWTRHVTHMQVNTNFQGTAAQISATFETLPGAVNGGLNFVSFAEATVPSKQLTVQVQNYNYNRLY